MSKYLLFVAIAVILAGIAGIIGHGVIFANQSGIILNTYIPCWFSGIFAFAGLCLLYLLIKPTVFLMKPFYFYTEVAFNLVYFLAVLVCLVCYAIVGDWNAFAWLIVTLVPILVSLYYLLNFRNDEKVHPEDERPGCLFRFASIVFSMFKFFAVFFLALLCAGAVEATIANSFTPPSGSKTVSVLFDGAGKSANLELYCIGTTNSTLPTIFLVADSAHGIVDFYGLQYYLHSIGGTSRRVCSYDNIGFGWSQDSISGEFTNYEFFYRLLQASGEPQPWHVVAWGGGGSTATAIVTNHTSSIKSVTFVEAYPPGIEFNYYGVNNSLSHQQVLDYRANQLAGRVALAQIILDMAIPWGLMSLFFPISPQDPNYYPPDKWKEYRVQLWKSKSWITQLQGLKYLQSANDAADPLNAYGPLPSAVPVFGVYCSVPASCYTAKDDAVQKDYYNQQKFAMVRALSANAVFVNNTDCDCALSLPVAKAQFTATSILSLYASINA
ncbi:hypothetical protein HDV04_004422 [Boothiomyces sp. JEL0838]|nr:hypothetical protein HDV04_004422 [Boothiomyces sp. JEL0838]